MCLKTNTHTHPCTVECAEYGKLYVHVCMWLHTDVACARHVSEQQEWAHRFALLCPATGSDLGKGSVIR